MASASSLAPTFYGHIASTQDALILFETCLSGALNHVARRPHDRERVSLIKSGNVFIYEEHSSGIKRWTDGVPWSPSRILGNFLVYRELERPFPPGEKKRAMKRSKRSPGISKQELFGSPGSTSGGYNAVAASSFDSQSSGSLSKETERSLIGSLVDSYGFKEGGLVKKTISVSVGGVHHHLVSYYSVEDIMNNKFITPTQDHRFQSVSPRHELIAKQNWRTPIDEIDSVDRTDDRSVYASNPYAHNAYEMTNQSISQRSLSLPTPPLPYQNAAPSAYPNYAVGPNPGQYDGVSLSTGAPYHSQSVTSLNDFSMSRPESYDASGYRHERYNSLVGNGSETAQSQMPQAAVNFTHHPSNYVHGSSIDSGISGVSSSSTESKFVNDPIYQSQEHYDGHQDNTGTPQSYSVQRSLPTPTQQIYDRSPLQIYSGVDPSNLKENIWPVGNASTGHAHYIAPQQQWTSTGST